MKTLLLTAFLLVFTGCSHGSLVRKPSSETLPRHIIIAVHGIGGDASTWNEMSTVLPAHLQIINPNYKYEFYSFVYPSAKKSDKNTFNFAREDLGQFIAKEVFGQHDIQPKDKITLVAHSQGGLVSMIWYIETLVSDEPESDPDTRVLQPYIKYARQVESIVTLGTPFWGSKLAVHLTDPTKIQLAGLAKLNNPQELQEMSFGSNTVYKFRRAAIALSRRLNLRDKVGARMTNISGIFPSDKKKLYYQNCDTEAFDYKIATKALDLVNEYFTKIGFGYDRYESDIAVLVPHSRINFLYGEDLEGDSSRVIDFKSANFFANHMKQILVETIHSPVNSKYNVSMAAIPGFCLRVEDCVHPTYRYILQEVANCGNNDCDNAAAKYYFTTLAKLNEDDNRTNRGLEENLHGFTIDVVLRLPKGYDIEDSRFKDKPGLAYSKILSNHPEHGDSTVGISPELFFKKAVSIYAEEDGTVKSTSPLVRVNVGSNKEYISKFLTEKSITFRGSSHSDIRLTITGTIVPTSQGTSKWSVYQTVIGNGVNVPMDFHLPGLVPRRVNVLVKPGISTYLELQTQYKN